MAVPEKAAKAVAAQVVRRHTAVVGQEAARSFAARSAMSQVSDALADINVQKRAKRLIERHQQGKSGRAPSTPMPVAHRFAPTIPSTRKRFSATSPGYSSTKLPADGYSAAHQEMNMINAEREQMGMPPIQNETPIYKADTPGGQKALSSDVKSAVAGKIADKAIDKGMDAAVDVAAKVGPAPVKAGAAVAKVALKNEAVRNAARGALKTAANAASTAAAGMGAGPLQSPLSKAAKLGNNETSADDKKSGESVKETGNSGRPKKKDIFGREKKDEDILPQMLKKVVRIARIAAPVVIPIILVLALISMIGSCSAGIFGIIAGGGDESGVIEQSRDYIPKAQVNLGKPICDDDSDGGSNSSSSDSSAQGNASENNAREPLNKAENDPEPTMYIDPETGFDRRRAGMENIYENVFEIDGKIVDSSKKSVPKPKKAVCAAVVDASGYLYGKNAHAKVKIASVTKIMTALIASEFLNTKVTVTKKNSGDAIPGSGADTKVGDKATVKNMLKPLLLISANDTAFSIATSCGREMLKKEGNTADAKDEDKCLARFVERMNEKARELGMKNTKFNNPAGLDDSGFEGDHVSTAYDVVLMTRAAYEVPLIKKIVSCLSTTWTKKDKNGKKYKETLGTSNSLLLDPDTSKVCKGMKAGNTVTAGMCVSEVFDNGKGQHPVFVVVLGQQPGWDGDIGPMYEDAKALYKWAKGKKVKGKGLALDSVDTNAGRNTGAWISAETDNSKSNSSSESEREDCIELNTKKKDSNTKSPVLGDWVYYNQIVPNWSGWDNTSFGSSCGQVAMAMVCATYGGDAEKYNPNWLRTTKMRYGNQGLNQPGCVEYINDHKDEFHLKASSGHWCVDQSSWDKMKKICDAGGCIVLYQVKYSSSGRHWVVVRSIDGDNVTVANPNGGKESVFSKAEIIKHGCPNGSGAAADAIYLEKI